MSEMRERQPPLPPPFRRRLLPTTAEMVADDVVSTLRSLCEQIPGIEHGYVCAVEDEREGGDPERRLSFAVKLTRPVLKPADGRDMSREIATRLVEAHEPLARELGSGVLADVAIPAWEQNALRVFTR